VNIGKPLPIQLKLDQNERSDDTPTWVKPFLNSLDDSIFWCYPQKAKAETAWADFLGLDKEQVILTNGSDEAISVLFSTLEPASQVILPLPAFGVYMNQCSQWPIKAEIIQAATDLSIDREAVQKKLEQVQNGLFILTRPNNPTGESIPGELLISWLTLAQENGTMVLLDEAYAEFAGQTCLPLMEKYSNLMIIKTLSKAYGLAGFRIGIFLGSSAVLEPIRKRFMPFNLSSPAVELAVETVKPIVQNEVTQYCLRINKNRQHLFEILNSWGVSVFPGKGNFLLLKTGSPRNQLIANFLKSCGIAVRLFDRDGLRDTVRITIPIELDLLIEVLGQVLRPELICLDVDGCLMDVSSSFDAAIVETVFHFTGSPVTTDDIGALRTKTGYNSDFSLTHELVRQRGGKASLAEVTEVFELRYWGRPGSSGTQQNEKPLITPNTMEFIEETCHTALVTGRNRRELEPIFTFPVFSKNMFSITTDDVKEGKPHPAGIKLAQSKFGTQKCWMVGDNVDDILAAVASNSVPIGIGEQNEEQLTRAGACIVLKDINEIRSLLS